MLKTPKFSAGFGQVTATSPGQWHMLKHGVDKCNCNLTVLFYHQNPRRLQRKSATRTPAPHQKGTLFFGCSPKTWEEAFLFEWESVCQAFSFGWDFPGSFHWLLGVVNLPVVGAPMFLAMVLCFCCDLPGANDEFGMNTSVMSHMHCLGPQPANFSQGLREIAMLQARFSTGLLGSGSWGGRWIRRQAQ